MPKGLIFAVLVAVLLPTVAAGGGLGDMVIDNQKHSREAVGVGPVVFPHTRHEKLYKCSDCHPKIFVKKRGANRINMKLNMSGKFCGAPDCHNSLKAFPLFKCFKCHKKTGS